MRNDQSCRAFTLTELLAVIGIIAILAGLLLPVSIRALDKARSAKCAANMASIYRAYQMRVADEAKNTSWMPLRTAGWAGILLAYVDGKEKIFRCPSDRIRHWGGVDAMLPLGRFPGEGVSFAYGVSPFASGRYHAEKYGEYWKKQGDLVGWAAGMPEQYASIVFYNGSLGAPAGWKVFFGTCRSDQTSRNVFTEGPAAEFTVLPAQKQLRLESVQIPMAILLDGKGEPNKQTRMTELKTLASGTLINVGMVTACSYGMNDYDVEGGIFTSGVNWLHETYSYFWPKVPANRILLMDYTNALIVAHTMASNTVTWTETDRARFKRHNSATRANVLFGDGTVQLMDPAEIDPGGAGKYAKYWQPEPP